MMSFLYSKLLSCYIHIDFRGKSLPPLFGYGFQGTYDRCYQHHFRHFLAEIKNRKIRTTTLLEGWRKQVGGVVKEVGRRGGVIEENGGGGGRGGEERDSEGERDWRRQVDGGGWRGEMKGAGRGVEGE